jgi:hypothetical protein
VANHSPYCNSTGSLAMFAATRRASSSVSTLAWIAPRLRSPGCRRRRAPDRWRRARRIRRASFRHARAVGSGESSSADHRSLRRAREGDFPAGRGAGHSWGAKWRPGRLPIAPAAPQGAGIAGGRKAAWVGTGRTALGSRKAPALAIPMVQLCTKIKPLIEQAFFCAEMACASDP